MKMKEHDLVWAKLKGFPTWPAKVIRSPSGNDIKSKMHKVYVRFFGSNTCAWVSNKNITHHSEDLLKVAYEKRSPSYKKAIKAFLTAKNDVQNHEMKRLLHQYKIKKCEIRLNRIDLKNTKFAIADTHSQTESKRNIPPPESFKYEVIECLQQPKQISSKNTATERKSNNKIGFIGLENMGQNIVEQFLKVGYNISIWNIDLDKCTELIKKGANIGQSPAEIIATCNIIFSSFSDQKTFESILHIEGGILSGFSMAKESKKYIELTSFENDFSERLTISKVIGIKNGKYLEASLQGSIVGNLLIFASGDESLFNECEFLFCNLGESKYLGSNIGWAKSFNDLMNSVLSDKYNIYERAKKIIQKAKFPLNVFDEIFNHKYFNVVSQIPTENIQLKECGVETSIDKYCSDRNNTTIAAASNSFVKNDNEDDK